jgi:carbonic anhydrase/acetyltransferase-like protein (isoleucine patch superfamily)
VIAAGTLIRENVVVEPFSLMAGVPGRLIRQIDENNRQTNQRWAQKYVEVAKAHREKGFSA